MHLSQAVALAAALSAGCSETAVQLELTSDRPLDTIAGLCVAVDAASTTRFSHLYSLAGAPLPQSLTIFSSGPSTATARASGIAHGQVTVAEVAAIRFQPGAFVRQTVSLDRCPASGIVGSSTFKAGATMSASATARALLIDGPLGAEALLSDGGATMILLADQNLAVAGMLAAPASGALLLAADLNGDCNADLLASGAGASLWPGGADGLFTSDPTALPTGAGGVSAASGDLDGDGIPDLALCGGASLRILRNDGQGRFADLPSALNDEGDPATDITACAIADFDGDGHLDLAVAQGSAAPAQNRIYVNDPAGTGHLTYSPGALPPLPERTTAIVAGDVDGDGQIDLIAAHADGPVRLYLNRGAGLLDDRSFGLLPDAIAANVPSLLLVDLDGDCALDLVVPRAGAAPLVWRNDGAARFTAAAPLPGGDALEAAALDIDGDGLLDLLLSGGAQGLAVYLQIAAAP